MKFPREQPVILNTKTDDVVFQITSWYSKDAEYGDDEEDRLDNTKYLVKIFGVTETGQSVSVNLLDYPPFFYIKSPVALNDFHIKMLRDFIVEKLPFSLKNGLIDVKLMAKKDFWGFTDNKRFHFVRLSFKNLKTFQAASRLFSKKVFIQSIQSEPIFMKLYESNIDPFLRLSHIRNIDPAGWARIPANQYDINTDLLQTRCQIDIECKWTKIEPIQIEKMAPLIIASFDIECTSSHGDFPVPHKVYGKTALELYHLFKDTDNKDIVYNELLTIFDHSEPGKLSKVYPKDHIKVDKSLKRAMDDIMALLQGKMAIRKPGTQGSQGTFEKPTAMARDAILKGLTDALGKCLPLLEGDPVIQIGTTVHVYGETECTFKHILTLGTCDPIEGVEVESCKNEKELILRWRDLINALDPDVLIGYNIFGFDMSYLYERAREHKIEEQFCEIGKIIDYPSPYIEKILSSSALGDNELKYINMEGRVLIDMMKVVQRDHKLDSYKLDTVASTFLGGKIIEYESDILTFDNIKGVSIDSYVKFGGDGKYKIVSIKENSKGYAVTVSPTPLQDEMQGKWGLAKDDITPNQIFACQNGTSEDRAMVAKYCVKDCSLCNYLVMKLETLANNVGMANVCSVPLSFIFMRGQGIKIFSLVAKQCRSDDFLIPCLNKPNGCGKCGKYVAKEDKFECKRCSRSFHKSSCLHPDTIVKSFICADCVDLEDEGYEGAIVLEPKEGIYIDTPISVLDYASLYPSSMISENLSHDSIVLDPKYDNLEGQEYLDICYDVYEMQGNIKVKTGEKKCRFAQLAEKGTIPRILMHLLKQRKTTRKKIEFQTVLTHTGETYIGLVSTEENNTKITDITGNSVIILKENIKSVIDTYDEFQKAVLDGLQVAYKLTANSLYGQCGAKTSQIYMKEIAACTTATGRKMIMTAKEFIEKKTVEFKIPYEPEVIYGDSVVGYTPSILKINDKIIIEKIEDIAEKYGDDKWIKCSNSDKEACELKDINVWTSEGWTTLKRVIRHELAPHKKILRILTHTGVVDVTDEHSLINSNHEIIDAKEVKIGDMLLHKDIPSIQVHASTITPDEARIMGIFMGDGSCGCYDCPSGFKSSWAINNSDYDLLELYQEICENEYPEFSWRILPTLESSGVYKLVPGSLEYGTLKVFIKKYRDMMYEGQDKIVPEIILNGTLEVRKAFWKGLYDADGDKDIKGYTRIDQDSQLSAATIYMLAGSIGYKVSINIRDDKPTIYRLTMTMNSQRKHKDKIKKIKEIAYKGYVYDFTTENHEFSAGVGRLIVHNTDSIFLAFHFKDAQGNPLIGKATIPLSRELGIKISTEFKKLLKPPHDLEWEKLFYPFVLLSKKRYCANKYEHDDDKYKMSSMGIVLKRRDNAQIVKTIYGGILNIILNEQNVRKSIAFLQDNLKDMIEGKSPLSEFIITKSLKSDYKDPEKIAHKVLAERMGERDIGTKPKSNERIPYAYVETPVVKGKKTLQGERIEHPDYIVANNLKIDYEHYITNQLMKPIVQVYALVLEQLDGYKKRIDYKELKEKLIKEKGGDVKKAKEKWNDLREEEVKKMLFDPFLIKLENKRNKMKSITDFFGPK